MAAIHIEHVDIKSISNLINSYNYSLMEKRRRSTCSMELILESL